MPIKLTRNRWRSSPLSRALRILPQKDQKKLVGITLVQIGLGILDLLGVLAIGLLGALGVSAIQSQEPNQKINSVLAFLKISDLNFKLTMLIVGIFAIAFLVGRTLLSIFLIRKVLFFLSGRGAEISANLVARLLAQPLLTVQAATSQKTLYALTNGVNIITLQILATAIVLISDCSLMLLMLVGLFFVDPLTSLGTLLIFSFIALILYKLMQVKAARLGIEHSNLNIKSNEKIVEVLASYRESVVRNRRDFYSREIGKLRVELADNSAELSFMPYVSKYVIETAVIIGALFIGGLQFILNDLSQAVSTLSIFFAAGSRIAPAVLRVQQGSIQIRGNLGKALPTLNLIDELGNLPISRNTDDSLHLFHTGFSSEISANNLGVKYPNSNSPAISDVSFEIQAGKSIALVGPSGAGKTTLVDLLLGILDPDQGSITISGLSPKSAIEKWPGAISYLPQDVVIISGTIRQNVSLGYPLSVATDELVIAALKFANLDEFALDLPKGIDTEVGERGTQLSGGQRQRLGIARAIFTNPKLLVLDEATSSLDADTEESITAALQGLDNSTTVLTIAHRLSTVEDADLVLYLNEGRLKALGTFNEVRKSVPDFDRQARLMGL